MIKFQLDDYKIELSEWAKHHKEVGILVKRVKFEEDRETISTISVATKEDVRKLAEKHEDKLLKEPVSFFDEKEHKLLSGVDYYLPIPNIDYITPDYNGYFTGSTNTTQKSKIRFHFKVEYIDFYLDVSYESSGSYATSFADYISRDITSIIDDAIHEKEFEEVGIQKVLEDGEEFYEIIGVNENKSTDQYTFSIDELVNSLVGVELYDHETIII